MTIFLVEAIGFLAAIVSFVIFLPQALRTWRVRRDPIALAGISIGTQWLILCNATLWGAYAFLTEAFWVGAPGILNAPLAIFTIFLVLRARSVPLVIANDCVFCRDEIDHQVFITAPPGWGSIMPCSEATRSNGIAVADRGELLRLRESRSAQL